MTKNTTQEADYNTLCCLVSYMLLLIFYLVVDAVDVTGNYGYRILKPFSALDQIVVMDSYIT
ncbi:hypothetical protein A6S26_23730 [Nostoc sp. ATCC 43529]|nr:hypothetical protein A6S26_23730 [Nostoc sp. ATCC 43529]